eukprot:gene13709-16161_t
MSSSPTTIPSILPPLRDKRSNRRRVSCGFHHKRHQACPESCEGRISHPPEYHTPIQDKFTVGCSECRVYFQTKSLLIPLPSPPQQQSANSQQLSQQQLLNNINTTNANINNINNAINNLSHFSSFANGFSNNNIIKSTNNKINAIKKQRNTMIPEIIIENKPNNSNTFHNDMTNYNLVEELHSPITSSPSTSRPLSPIGASAEVPSIQRSLSPLNKNMTSINLLAVSSSKMEAVHEFNPELMELRSNDNGQVKRKVSSSPELLYSDDSAHSSPSSFVPSPTPSPTLTPRTNNLVQQPSSPANSANSSSFSGNTAQADSPATRLLLLEHEVEREIFSQNEQELFSKKKIQREEQENVNRIQQLIDYQKVQQRMEYQRLKRQSDELEQWRVKLEILENDLKAKASALVEIENIEELSNLSNNLSNNNNATSTNNNANSTILPKVHINTDLLKQASQCSDFSPLAPLKIPSPSLLQSIDNNKSSCVPDTTKAKPMVNINF